LFFVSVFLCFSLLCGKIEERNDSVVKVPAQHTVMLRFHKNEIRLLLPL
jgi:hypothetical protein